MAKITVELPISESFTKMYQPQMLEGIRAFVVDAVKTLPMKGIFQLEKITCRFSKE